MQLACVSACKLFLFVCVQGVLDGLSEAPANTDAVLATSEKNVGDGAGVAFRFEQTTTSTVVHFDLPGACEGGKAVRPEIAPPSHNDFTRFTETEQAAVEVARRNGRVTAKALMDAAGVGRTNATSTLKALVEKGVLVWVGKSVRDPRQYYRLPEEG